MVREVLQVKRKQTKRHVALPLSDHLRTLKTGNTAVFCAHSCSACTTQQTPRCLHTYFTCISPVSSRPVERPSRSSHSEPSTDSTSSPMDVSISDIKKPVTVAHTHRHVSLLVSLSLCLVFFKLMAKVRQCYGAFANKLIVFEADKHLEPRA